MGISQRYNKVYTKSFTPNNEKEIAGYLNQIKKQHTQ